jgi:hypothetical protein
MSVAPRLPCLGLAVLLLPTAARGACCYFSAKDQDVLQPSQKAFIAFDEKEKVESFTVQPKFEGNAKDFGMVVPTPSRPKLDEMPRDFFKELAVFTILEPMDLTKYKQIMTFAASPTSAVRGAKSVRILEAGIVGSLEYKIIQADRADDLYQWLKDNAYNYGGDEATLDRYIKKGWFFTVMKIDPVQMKKRPDGSYEGEVTPTRFTFASERLIYPLKITQISVKDRTEALFYVQADVKMDLPEELSHQLTFLPMWSQAMDFAIPEKVTKEEKAWQEHVKDTIPRLLERAQRLRANGREPSKLEWARRLTAADMEVLAGERPYNRQAPKEDVEKLKVLQGHLKKDRFVTKIRKVFTRDEMEDDLLFVRAQVDGKDDTIEYTSILPTSPP